MFTTTVIMKTPSGRFSFVGRVHESLLRSSFETLEDAKVAAIDCMLKIGETFPVDVSPSLK